MKNKENTFSYWGYFFNAPLSLNDNIREWISTNISEEYQQDLIPTDVDFASLDAALTSTTVEEPDWYRDLDTYLRELLYCCIQAVKQPTRTSNTRAGRPSMEGKTRRYIVADDVHEWIIAHGGGKYITDTMRTIMAVQQGK